MIEMSHFRGTHTHTLTPKLSSARYPMTFAAKWLYKIDIVPLKSLLSTDSLLRILGGWKFKDEAWRSLVKHKPNLVLKRVKLALALNFNSPFDCSPVRENREKGRASNSEMSRDP